MRAISVFRLEVGTSTFWCRARIALRIRVNMSATGSVNFIALLLLSRPFSPPQQRTCNGPCNFGCPILNFASAAKFWGGDLDLLPGRLRNSRNLAAQCQSAET